VRGRSGCARGADDGSFEGVSITPCVLAPKRAGGSPSLGCPPPHPEGVRACVQSTFCWRTSWHSSLPAGGCLSLLGRVKRPPKSHRQAARQPAVHRRAPTCAVCAMRAMCAHRHARMHRPPLTACARCSWCWARCASQRACGMQPTAAPSLPAARVCLTVRASTRWV